MSNVRLIDTDDDCSLRVEVDRPGGATYAVTYQWATRELALANRAKAIDTAVRNATRDEFVAGEGRTVRSAHVGPLTFYLGHLWGPPRWNLPKVGGKRSPGYCEVMAGWWLHAVVFGVRWADR